MEIETVASTHGPVWRSQPERIIELYDKWSSGEGEEGVTIVYGSMYGNTTDMVEAVADGVREGDCKNLKVLDASRVHPSFLLKEAWRRKGLIVGAPTYDARIFPPVEEFMNVASHKKLQNRVSGIFGSYGWSGGSIDRLESAIEDLGWDLLEPFGEFRGKPTEEELEKGKELGKAVAQKVTS